MASLTNNTDITNFLTNGIETLICSDFEGTLPTEQIKKFESVFINSNIDSNNNLDLNQDLNLDPTNPKQIVYLGDIFDNTGGCTSYNNTNYCALKILKYLVDYPEKSRYVVGNRDINKIKLVPLLQFADDSKWWLLSESESESKTWFQNKTNGKIWKKSSNIQPYEVIAINLLNSSIKSSIWKVETMEKYIPFWSKKTELNTHWINKDGKCIKPMITLYDRFLRIFGLDTSEGTMSAENTLKYIPDELFPELVSELVSDQVPGQVPGQVPSQDQVKVPEIQVIVNKIRNKIDKKTLETNIKNSTTFTENIKTNEKKKLMNQEEITKLLNKFIDYEIRSAIVFTVFMRMLDKDLYKQKTMPISFSLNKIGDLDGYLWKYLTTASPALYAKQNNDLLLFSHGGITQEFITTTNNKNGLNILNEMDLDEWGKVLNGNAIDKKITSTPSATDNNIPEKQSDINIIEKIESYNKLYFEILNRCFENFKKNEFNKEIMVLLSISAPAENNSVIFNNGYTTSNLSPIQPKLPITSILTKEGENINVFNFCGHASAGFGYGFKKVADYMYFISTDFSSSLYKKGICSPTYNDNFLSLTIKYVANLFKLHLNGKIFLDSTFIDNKPQIKKNKEGIITNTIPAIKIGDNSNSIFSSELEKYQVIVVNDNFENLNKSEISVNQEGVLDDSFFKRNENYYDKDFIFNGMVTYGGKNYDQYSYFNFISPAKTRTILILSPSNIDEEMLGGNRKNLNKYKSIKKNRKYKTKGKLFKKNSTRNRKMKSNKKH